MFEFFTNINFVETIEDVSKWIGVAAVVAAATPTTKDNTVVNVIKMFVDFVGFNFGHARNQEK